MSGTTLTLSSEPNFRVGDVLQVKRHEFSRLERFLQRKLAFTWKPRQRWCWWPPWLCYIPKGKFVQEKMVISELVDRTTITVEKS